MVLMMKKYTKLALVCALLCAFIQVGLAQSSRLNYADRQYELANYRIAADEYGKGYAIQASYELAKKTATSLDNIYAYSESYSWWKKVTTYSESSKEDYAALVRAGYRSIKGYDPTSDLAGTAYKKGDFEEFTAVASPGQVAIKTSSLTAWNELNSAGSDYGITEANKSGIQFFSSNKGEGVSLKKSGIRWDAKGSRLNKSYFNSDGKNYYGIYSVKQGEEPKRVQVLGFELYHLTDPQATSTGKLFFTGTPNPLSKKDKVIYPGIFYGTYDEVSGQVTEVKAFPFNQTDAFGVISPRVDEQQKRLYFSSNRPGSLGGYDLYYVSWDGEMNFSDPVNLGSTINTAYNERDGYRIGNEFYYSSDKTGGLGGLDVYMASVQGEKYTNSVNLGEPVNSVADDFGFVKTAANKIYLASDRVSGAGSDDIYTVSVENRKLTFNVLNEVGNQINSGTKLQLVSKGQTLDISGKPSEEVVNLLENGSTYTVIANRPGYFPQELVFSFNENNTDTDLSLKMQAIPYELQVYEAIIYYDLDKDFLRDLSKEKLDEITAYLSKHPELNLVIESHTDSRASVDYNEKLSERRAKSVIQYLEMKGISSSRISAKWFNEEKLVNPCGDGVPCPEADHQLNRRSELKLIAFPDPTQSYSLPKGASTTDFQSREAAMGWFLKK
jgi:outer membrane protein OmpA-like peptidoglycan-associated protein